MAQALMAYQAPHAFNAYSDTGKGVSAHSSSRRSSGRLDEAYPPPSSFPPSCPPYRGSWSQGTTTQYQVGMDSQPDHEYRRRFSDHQQGGGWSRSSSTGSSRDSYIQPSTSPSFNSPSWTTSQEFPSSGPPISEFSNNLSSCQYSRPLSISPISGESVNWNGGDTSGYQGVGVGADLRSHVSSMREAPYPESLNVQVPPFDSQSWSDMIMSAMDHSAGTPYNPPHGVALNGYTFPHQMSPVPSPPPSPPHHTSVSRSPISSTKSSPPNSRRSSVDRSGNIKKCSHCQATSTPLWRREPTTLKPLCNACGLYLQQRNKLRPQELIDADADDGDSTDESDQNYVGPECSHCRTHHTSVWRRSKSGEQLCNACGVYARLRGKPRPLSLKRNKIKPRSKHAPKTEKKEL